MLLMLLAIFVLVAEVQATFFFDTFGIFRGAFSSAMPFLHCADCGVRTFKNWDAADTDDDEDFFCTTCNADTQWITEAEFQEKRRRRRSGDQQQSLRRSSEDYRLQQRLFGEEQERKYAEQHRLEEVQQQQRQQQEGSPKLPGPKERVAVDRDLLDSDSPLRVAGSPTQLKSPRSHPARPRRASVNPPPNPALPVESVIEVLIREVPTLGIYVRRLREEVLGLRRDKALAADQLSVWQRQSLELEAEKAGQSQEAAVLMALNSRLREENRELQDNVALLHAQLKALGVTPRAVPTTAGSPKSNDHPASGRLPGIPLPHIPDPHTSP